jgi:hypothetical protein
LPLAVQKTKAHNIVKLATIKVLIPQAALFGKAQSVMKRN